MIASTLLFAAVASTPLPRPLSDTEMRDIGCIATLAIIADDQRNGKAPALRFPNVMQRGRTYAGLVGARIVEQSGQPREVIALAIRKSAQAQRTMLARKDAKRSNGEGSATGSADRLNELAAPCITQLNASVPADDPTIDDYRYCAAIIKMTADDLEAREGKESINAKVMRGLADTLADKYSEARFPPGAPLPKLSTGQWISMMIDRQVAELKSQAEEEGAAIAQAPDNALGPQDCLYLGD